MKKMVSLLLAVCMMLPLLVGCGAPAQDSGAGGLTVNVTVPSMGHTGNISNDALMMEIAEHMVQYDPADAASIMA